MAKEGFQKRLKELRLEKNLSQTELGDMIGVHYTHIGRYERGLSIPKSATMRRLAEALGVTTDYLFEGKMDEVAKSRLKDRDLLQMFNEVEKLTHETPQKAQKILSPQYNSQSYLTENRTPS